MLTNRHSSWRKVEQRGAALVLIAAAMIFVLGMAGLAIDLGSLYVGRSQAQRAADAAALAGATAFADSGCTSTGTCSAAQSYATDRAVAVGNQNLVADVNPNIQPGSPDINFDFSNPQNPRITVTVFRDTAHKDPMPTFFMKIFGVQTANISAQATAEAFNPSGQNGSIGAKCVKPWLLPNCDPGSPSIANQNCNPAVGKYINDDTQNYTIADPNAIGKLITLKPGDPSQAGAPSQFYEANLPSGTVPMVCPSCANGNGGNNGGSLYRQNIECCNTNTIVCGANPIGVIKSPTDTGNKVGPTTQGVDCLIGEGKGSGSGQDTITYTAGNVPPFEIFAGSATASSYGVETGTQISDGTSSSVVTVPVYNGQALCPGSSCGGTVNVIGLLKMFIVGEGSPQGTVEAYIMDISACGSSSGSTGGGTVVATGGGASVPVRLIHQ
jgi:Putative Flp pilus-assembly TadE/G-like